MDILNDTYGKHNSIGVSLSIEVVDGDSISRMQLILTTLLGFPSSSQGDALKCLLRENADIKLKLWKPVSYEHFTAFLPDGTCDYHFLYQLYLRGIQASPGAQPDAFPSHQAPQNVLGFCSYLNSLMEMFSISTSDDILMG